MIAEVRARRLAEVRKRQHAIQVKVAAAMGVSQARVSRIEKGGTVVWYTGLLRFLADYGLTVIEVDRPDRANRRRNGKSEPPSTPRRPPAPSSPAGQLLVTAGDNRDRLRSEASFAPPAHREARPNEAAEPPAPRGTAEVDPR